MNQVDQLNGAALAYIGDAIYEVYVRQHVIASGLTQPNRLHRAATRYVEAKGQAYAMQCLRDQEILNEEELTIYKRGRNHKANTKAKNASIGDYRQATGFEALLGWLHLSGQSQRLEELIAQSLALIDQRGQ
ncbi:ribonuclease III domain-containing protein [uncultured Abiotrophia sp.]|jgi:hypothetical protein|uniref:Mini-ribonuclease 3 n=1 Tax=uncultured Abiotrophia sp. TaxID=316094 RepID=UPI0028D3B112|nr:ribonuclease III domain-containing protein [uncultured Abiotrophia sp.]